MEASLLGVFSVPKGRETIQKDQLVYWWPKADPVMGELGTGAVLDCKNEYPMGIATEFANEDDAFCRVRIPVTWRIPLKRTLESLSHNLTKDVPNLGDWAMINDPVMRTILNAAKQGWKAEFKEECLARAKMFLESPRCYDVWAFLWFVLNTPAEPTPAATPDAVKIDCIAQEIGLSLPHTASLLAALNQRPLLETFGCTYWNRGALAAVKNVVETVRQGSNAR